MTITLSPKARKPLAGSIGPTSKQLSIGLENAEDLIADLDGALTVAQVS